jgi:hypothetical protein
MPGQTKIMSSTSFLLFSRRLPPFSAAPPSPLETFHFVYEETEAAVRYSKYLGGLRKIFSPGYAPIFCLTSRIIFLYVNYSRMLPFVSESRVSLTLVSICTKTKNVGKPLDLHPHIIIHLMIINRAIYNVK